MSRAAIREQERYRAEMEELLDCGRAEGILIDYLDQEPLFLCHEVSPLLPVTDVRNPFSFAVGNEIDIELLCIPDGALVEKITTEKHALSLIASALKLGAVGLAEGELKDFSRSECLRLEEPLMRDNFILPRPKDGIKDFEPLPVNEENDEGLTWSTRLQKGVREFKKNLGTEILDTPTDAQELLRCCDQPEEIGFDDVLCLEHTNNRRLIREPLSPPLLVLPPQGTPKPLALDPESLGVEPLPMPSDADMVEAMTEQLMDEDLLRTRRSSSPGHFMEEVLLQFSHLKTPQDQEGLGLEVPLSPLSQNGLRLEVPLSPPQTVGRIRFAPSLKADIQPLLPPSGTDLTPQTQLEDVVQAEVEQLQREMAQEQLKEADAKMRIEVPVMDFSIPKMPWEITRQDMENIRYLDNWAGNAKRMWRGIKTVELNMRWAPFTRKDDGVPPEQIEGSVELPLTAEECALSEQELVDSLAVVCMSNNTEETLEYAVIEKSPMTEAKDKASPVRKRKQPADTSLEDVFKRMRNQAAVVENAPQPEDSADQFTFNGFSTASALDAFMRSQGMTPSPAVNNRHRQMLPPPRPVNKPPQLAAIKPPSSAPPPPPPMPPSPYPAAPVAAPNLPPADFVISFTLAERGIFKSIKSTYPAARFIERDFRDMLGDFHTLGSIRGRMVIADADLIVSPTSGLILTTLNRLNIRSPLPGGTPGVEYGRDIKTRIFEVSKRYEHLQVLVRVPAKVLTEHEIEALDSFKEFAVSMKHECTIEPRLVRDSEEEAARWIIAAMKSHGHVLNADETEWEKFLRNFGLNAMAAQVLLQECETPDGVEWFLDMEDGERKARFAELLGGRVLERLRFG